jgi:hypothetical protein
LYWSWSLEEPPPPFPEAATSVVLVVVVGEAAGLSVLHSKVLGGAKEERNVAGDASQNLLRGDARPVGNAVLSEALDISTCFADVIEALVGEGGGGVAPDS